MANTRLMRNPHNNICVDRPTIILRVFAVLRLPKWTSAYIAWKALAIIMLRFVQTTENTCAFRLSNIILQLQVIVVVLAATLKWHRQYTIGPTFVKRAKLIIKL